MTFKQFIFENIKKDAELVDNINELGQEVIDNSDGYLLPRSKKFTRSELLKKGYRIKGSEEVEKEPLQVNIVLKNIAVAIGAEFTPIPPIGKHNKKSETFNDSKSKKYVTYVFTKNGISVPIIITNTKPQNVGLKFEETVEKSFKQQLKNGELIPDGLLDNIIQRIPTIESFENIDGIDYSHGKAEKREISADLNNVGKKISDLTIELKSGDDIYFSLKTPNATLSNSGIGGLFIEEKDKIKYTSKFFKSNLLLECLHVNFDTFATELTNYKNQTPSDKQLVETFMPTANESRIIIDYLASAYGYGYYLLKYSSLNDVTLMDLTEPSHVKKLVGGNATSISIKYPYFVTESNSSKQFTANITTENGALYKIEIRNVKGDIAPDMIQIKNTKESMFDFDFVSNFSIKTIGEMSNAKL